MKKTTLSILSGVVLATSSMVLGFAHSASADSAFGVVSWKWNYGGAGLIGGSGTFTTPTAPIFPTDPIKVYSITSISGTWEGLSIIDLLPLGSFGNNDNLLFQHPGDPILPNDPIFPQLTTKGLTFKIALGDGLGTTDTVNLAFSPGDNAYKLSTVSTGSSALANFAATKVPEPSMTLPLLILGAGGIVGARIRKL